MPRFIALVPARSDSKGIPDKNNQRLGNLTLVERAVESAFQAGLSEVFLSSDSSSTLEAAIARYPRLRTVLRSNSASTDSATASDVVFDFLASESSVTDQDFIVYLQPTSPFRTPEDIRTALELVTREEKPSNLVSVVEASPHPAKAVKLANLRIELVVGSEPTANRQTLPLLHYPNGAIYIFSIKDFLELRDIPIRGCAFLTMDKLSSFDIDSPEDLLLARLIWEHGHFGSS